MTAHRINPLQQQFVENYLRLGNASLAYKQIRPHVKNPDDLACQMLKKESVQLLIRNAQEISNQRIATTFEWKAERLKMFIDKCSEMQTVVDIKTGEEKKMIPADYINAGTRAIAELNKMQGHYAPEKHLNVNIEASQEKIRQVLIEYEKY